MAERVISSRVVDSKVIKQPGIFGGISNKFNSIGASIGGLCIAPFIFILAFGLLVWSENLTKNSITVSDLTLEKATEVSSDSGLKKLEGNLVVDEPVIAPEVGEASYYSYKLEEYEQVEKVEKKKVREVVDGQEIEKTVEETKLVDEWTKKESQEEWAEITIDGIVLAPEKAKLQLDTETKVYIRKPGEVVFTEVASGKTIESEIGDRRITVEYLPTSSDLIVIGELSQGRITTGDPYIISNLSDAELQERLETEESTQYWGLKIVIFILFWVGLSMLMRPILEFVEMIPIAGKAATTAATVLAAVLAFATVLVGSLIVKFWWLFIILGLVIFAVAVFAIMKYVNSKNTKVAEEKN